ncbi:MAG: tRNA threonylcarbamoyladenosine dehydratase [Longicatena sp.]
METPLQRMDLLIGTEGMNIIKNATVMIVGIGGVGSYAAEALARCGIGSLILVDGDRIAISNLNRQIHATFQSIGQEKPEVMKQRIETYRDNCNIICKDMFYNEEKNDELFANKVDFVVDAIDTMSSKLSLIQYCLAHKIPFISSMGMANRLDPTKIVCCDLMKTSYDPVAKIMRNLVRKHHIKGKIPVVYSSEHPSIQSIIVNEEGVSRKQKMPPASSPFVPSAAGLACASYVIQKLLQR